MLKRKLLIRVAQSLLVLLMSGNAYAVDQIVTTNADSGAGSLRQAISDAVDGDSITFNLSAGNESITISSALTTGFAKALTINGDNIVGSGVDITVQVTTPGTSTYPVFIVNPGTGKTVSLTNMTIRGGNAGTGSGGAIQMSSTASSLYLENVIVRDSAGRFGAGLYAINFTTVNIVNSTFTANTFGSHGGAMRLNGAGDVTITGSTISNNVSTATESSWHYGAGIYFQNNSAQGTLTIDKTTISNNTIEASRDGEGAGIWLQNVTTTTITNSTINNNNAGANSSGGGIYSFGGELILTNSTLFENTCAWRGGGLTLFNVTKATITNSTIAKNLSGLDGDGIYFSSTGNNFTIKNTILADNGSGGDFDFVLAAGTVVDNGFNIVETSNGYAWVGTGDITGDQASLNLSASLANNGTLNGTQTLALSTGSVAIDAGDSSAANGTVTVPPTDQRGLVSGSTRDIGAYEFGASADSTIPTGTINIDEGVATSSTSVNLTLSCSDNVACSQMQFSNDNTTYSSLETNGTSKSWGLSAGADGARTVYARFTDVSGNVSTAVSDSITLDTAIPSAPAITAPVNSITTSNTSRPVISGTAEVASTVTIYDDGTPIGMITATGGNWSLTGGAILTEGVHSFTAIATDQAGNTSAASAAITYTVELTTADTGIETGTRGIGAFTWWPIMLLVLLLRRLNSHKIPMMLFVLLSTQFNTLHADPKIYVGAGFGLSSLTPETSGSAYDVSDKSSQTSHLILGYQLDQNWLIELGWNDLGNAEISTSGTKAGEIDYTTYTLGGAYRVYTNRMDDSDFNVYLSAGVSRMDTETSLSITRKNENSIFIGGIAEYMFSNSLALRAKLESYDEDAASLSLNVVGYFGK